MSVMICPLHRVRLCVQSKDELNRGVLTTEVQKSKEVLDRQGQSAFKLAEMRCFSFCLVRYRTILVTEAESLPHEIRNYV